MSLVVLFIVCSPSLVWSLASRKAAVSKWLLASLSRALLRSNSVLYCHLLEDFDTVGHAVPRVTPTFALRLFAREDCGLKRLLLVRHQNYTPNASDVAPRWAIFHSLVVIPQQITATTQNHFIKMCSRKFTLAFVSLVVQKEWFHLFGPHAGKTP